MLFYPLVRRFYETCASMRKQEDIRLTVEIKAAHARGRGIYGLI